MSTAVGSGIDPRVQSAFGLSRAFVEKERYTLGGNEIPYIHLLRSVAESSPFSFTRG